MHRFASRWRTPTGNFRLGLNPRVLVHLHEDVPGPDLPLRTSTGLAGGLILHGVCLAGRCAPAVPSSRPTVPERAARRRPPATQQPAIILEVPLPEPPVGVIRAAGPLSDVLLTSWRRLTRRRRVTRRGVSLLALPRCSAHLPPRIGRAGAARRARLPRGRGRHIWPAARNSVTSALKRARETWRPAYPSGPRPRSRPHSPRDSEDRRRLPWRSSAAMSTPILPCLPTIVADHSAPALDTSLDAIGHFLSTDCAA